LKNTAHDSGLKKTTGLSFLHLDFFINAFLWWMTSLTKYHPSQKRGIRTGAPLLEILLEYCITITQ
jgi:hypothetical protein